MMSTLPARGISGHVVSLTVEVRHGPGETVMPEGFQVQKSGDAMEAIRKAGWLLPDPAGGQLPKVERNEPSEAQARFVTTKLLIPFVALPEKPGRHRLVLPPIPITVARANKQLMVLCTPPLPILIEDPIANEAAPKVRANPPPRPQRERWERAARMATVLAFALPLAVLLAWLIVWYRRRPKVVEAPPRVDPWITALQELDALRGSGLLESDRLNEYFDQVDHCCRKYLGERYGFDGLESTTEEIRQQLRRVYPPLKEPERIEHFLDASDFVKFAEVSPSREDCLEASDRAESIVRLTMPPRAAAEAAGRRPA